MSSESAADLLADAAARLESVTETPRLDAEILLAHAMNLSRAQLLARLREEAPPGNFEELLNRRLDAEPIAYILGEWEFYSLTFEIEPPVLVPRPETEHLVEVVLEAIGDRPAHVLDVGAGSGCVSIAIARNAPNCSVVACDIRTDFLDLARRNAARHYVADRIAFRKGNLFDALAPDDGPFDLICSNPPYVAEPEWEGLPATITRYEAPECLLGGADGLDIVRRLVAQAQDHLVPGGRLALEIGMGQYETVRELLEQNGYEEISARRDLAGIDRIAMGKKPGP
ncbi:MAG: peptide chain release factor N(5)-glutamine methyltransferase [Candidatus Hydrogenedentes bacterium]|nr:peptide chain release factor N(5)-glutamine methyltransferase [Candidatus Hydrogenedentota bacterium]